MFCSVVSGETDAVRVLASESVVAFLDRSPVFKGHVLVVPHAHVPTLEHLPADAIAEYFGVVQRVAVAVQHALGADGTFVAINNTVSQSVPHLHTHVVPRRRKDGLRGFFWPRQKYVDSAEMDSFGALISDALRT